MPCILDTEILEARSKWKGIRRRAHHSLDALLQKRMVLSEHMTAGMTLAYEAESEETWEQSSESGRDLRHADALAESQPKAYVAITGDEVMLLAEPDIPSNRCRIDEAALRGSVEELVVVAIYGGVESPVIAWQRHEAGGNHRRRAWHWREARSGEGAAGHGWGCEALSGGLTFGRGSASTGVVSWLLEGIIASS
jgi:hypothetical protein